MLETKQCTFCKQTLPATAFCSNKARKDGLSDQCRECKKPIQAAWYKANATRHKANIKPIREALVRANQQKLIEFLGRNPCVQCGQTEILLLDFDHLRDKVLNISQMISLSWKTIEKEIAKCQVLCVVCHRRKTAHTFGWYKISEHIGTGS